MWGGVLAFEIAQRLRREGEEVSLLFMLDPSEPKGESKKPDTSRKMRGSVFNGLSVSLNRIGTSFKISLTRRSEDIKLILGSKTLRKQIIKEWTEKIRLLVAKLLLSLGFRIPEDLRNNYIMEIYGNALKNYSPLEYQGKIILYFSGNIYSMRKYFSKVSKFYWKDVKAKNKIIIKDDDADHLGIVLEPHIEKWAAQLNESLRENKTN